MQKVISKFKEGMTILGLSIIFIVLLAAMIATIGFLIFAIKLAWAGVVL